MLRGIIASAGTVVGEFFAFRSIHHQVAWLNILGNDLSCINFFSRINKESSADPVIYRWNNLLFFPGSLTINTPLFLPGIGPFHGLYSVKR